MELAQQTHGTYASGDTPAKNFRDSEYHAFAKVTRNLHNANLQQTDTFLNIVRAVHDNQQLWNILAIDVANDDNRLPVKLKSQIFYLSEFVRFHTAKVIAKKASTEILIEINMSIMRGLRTTETSTS